MYIAAHEQAVSDMIAPTVDLFLCYLQECNIGFKPF